MEYKILDKNAFVEDYYSDSVGTQNNVLVYFRKVQGYERHTSINKDMLFFNSKEWEYVLEELKVKIKSISSLSSLVSMIDKYRIWASDIESLNVDHVNIRDIIKEKGIERYILENEMKSIITRKELYEIINNDIIYNIHDKVILMLMFEGVKGYEMEELRSLSINDCNATSLTLKTNEGQYISRIIKVPNSVIDMINKSHAETFYYLDNGNGENKHKRRKVKDTEYVIKFIGKNKPYDKIQLVTLRSRIAHMKNWSGIPFSPENITSSGMLDYLMRIELKEGRKPTNEEYKKVYHRFGENPRTNMNWSMKLKPLYEVYSEYFLTNKFSVEIVYDQEIEEAYYDLVNTPLPQEYLEDNDNDISNGIYQGPSKDLGNLNENLMPYIPEPDKKLGVLGEEIALKYLTKKHCYEKVELVSDTNKFGNRGYDIEIKSNSKVTGVEVKSTRTKNPYYIHITYNELRTAQRLKEKYSVLIIIFEEFTPKYAFIINDIFEVLNINDYDIDFLLHKIESDQLLLYGQQFVLKINHSKISKSLIEDFIEIVEGE